MCMTALYSTGVSRDSYSIRLLLERSNPDPGDAPQAALLQQQKYELLKGTGEMATGSKL